MNFVVDEGSRRFVDLSVLNLEYSGPLDLTQYFIKKKTFSGKTEANGMKIVFVDIYLGRRLLSIILTVFAPTVILNIVGHSSNYFKEFFFEAVISLNQWSARVVFFNLETRPRIPDTYSQASRRDREKISFNLGHRDEIEIYYSHSQASRREREFH